MLHQHRERESWLITQHAHGLLSGELARVWKYKMDAAAKLFPLQAEGDLMPSFEFLFAIAMHDYAWSAYDVSPRFTEEAAGVADFLHYPLAERLPLYNKGVRSLASMMPWAASLVSRHFSAFAGLQGERDFQRWHETFREGLMLTQDAKLRVEEALPYLQGFDLLSLYLCLTPPGALRDHLPAWLLADDTFRAPCGERISLRWEGDDKLSFDPFPFLTECVLEIPVYVLEGKSFATPKQLDDAWTSRTLKKWSVRICS